MSGQNSPVAFAAATIILIAIAIGLFAVGSAGILITGEDIYGILIVLGGFIASCVLGAMFEANRQGCFDANSYPDDEIDL